MFVFCAESLHCYTKFHRCVSVCAYKLVVLQLDHIALLVRNCSGHTHQLTRLVRKQYGYGEDTVSLDQAVLYDGSYHPVDSSEIAFKLAANLAFKAALPEAKPVLMEPIGELKVTVPDNYVGDVMGDLNKRRGRVMGMNPTGDGETVLEAEVPMAEMMSYAIDLRSMTQSRGTFTFNFVRYEDCPAAAQEKAIAEAKALADAE